jgi:ribonuclease HI
MTTQQFILMADGGSRGNPGPAASGTVIYKQGKIPITNGMINSDLVDPIYAGGEFLGNTTNNVAEWNGLLAGLKWLQINYDLADVDLQILLDSKLVVEQILGKWKVKQDHLKPFYRDCKNILDSVQSWEATHIYRENNKVADNLVNQVLDNL